MTQNKKALARIFFENRILKSDKQAFEDLFTEIMNYKEDDFRSIKPWGNIGDRKNDGYIKSKGIFYQVYAPENIENSYPSLIKKIKTDFDGLIKQWNNIQEFYFVLNDKYKGVNPDSEKLLEQIKQDNHLSECKFITAKDLENILFSLSDNQIIKITGVSFMNSTILSPAILKNIYLKKFDTISLLTNTPKPIDNIFVNLAIIKEQEKKKDNPKFIKREPILSSYEEIHKPKEPIAIKELINTSKKSLIYGRAGIGKTTLCKYIAYKWAKGEIYQEFEYVIYIPLREWKKDGIKGAILDYYYSLDEKNITIDFEAHKTLFLFDGYDELDADKKKSLRDEIGKYSLSHYIITTRPYGYQKSDFRVDKYFETIGFTDKNVIEYIDNFFGKDSEKSKGLKAYLETNISIKHIGYIPLMLEMICSLWEKQEKEFGSNMTMTELYGQVVEDMLKKHSANKDDKRVYTRKNRKKIQKQLGKLAFEGLIQQTILFDGDFIEESVDDIDFFEENSIYSGFLKSDAKEKDLLDNSFEFPHLTFQEYFSALYVSGLSKEEQSEIIQDWKFYPHMQMFFAFLGGLIEDKEFLLQEIESEPRDISLSYTLKKIFICINEFKDKDIFLSNFNKRITLLNQKNLINEWSIFKIGCHKNPNLLISSQWTFYKETNGKFTPQSKEGNDSFFDSWNDFFKKEEEDFLIFKTDNERLIDFLLSLLPRGFKGLDEDICNYLLSLNNHSEKIIIVIINFIEKRIAWGTGRRTLEKVLQLSNQNFTFFQQVYKIIKDTSLNYNLYRLNIKTLFRAFDEGYEVIDYIVLHCEYNIKPLYLKNKKLHTIENGKEISTQREVDETTLNEIKMMLRGEDLNG